MSIFSGGKLRSAIRWLKDKTELAYLIEQLIKTKKITSPDDNHWQITSYCFRDKNGQEYDSNKFRGLTKDIKKKKQADLDDIIKELA